MTTTLLDRRSERRLRHGDIAIDAKLDLHGLTQEGAFAALHRFIPNQAAKGHRHLLIITGKGGTGVLRTNVPRWLAEPRLAKHIRMTRPAAPKHGGDGAWYVTLRKRT